MPSPESPSGGSEPNELPDEPEQTGKPDYRRLAMDWHNASFKKEGDRYSFYDPATGEKLRPEYPAESLLKDEKLGKGYQFLLEFGHLMNLDIQYAKHSIPDDWGSTEYEARVASADIYLLEGIGWDEKLAAGLNHLSQTGKADDAVQQYVHEGNPELRMRELEAIAESGVKVGFFDIDHDEEDPLRSTLIAASDLIHEVRSNEDIPKRDRERWEWLNAVAVESMREWFIVGQLGHQIGLQCQNKPDLLKKLSEGNLSVFMTVGSSHKNLTDKLRGFNVAPHETHADTSGGNELLVEAIKNSYLPADKLEQALDD